MIQLKFILICIVLLLALEGIDKLLEERRERNGKINQG